MSSTHRDKEDHSDKGRVATDADTKIVMAEQSTHDVVKQAQSMGGPSPIDDPATTTNHFAGDGDAPSGPTNANRKPTEALLTTSTNATSTDTAQVDDAGAANKGGGELSTDSVTRSRDLKQPDIVAKDTKEQLVNGDTADHSASEDISSHHALGDVSGGSDTDISRPGSVDPAKERNGGHLRSNSLKKPTSFKSVSVTKNFLAKSAVSTPPARPGEKTVSTSQTSASAQQTARPRLVAKSGTGIGNTTRSSLSKMNGTGSGPDASKVWNKNQPVPPPPPKQFTDEELKQQYGIHLATRLQADEAGKEAKWADIEDDEDDWAPETVQWMDGTKSTVAAIENQPPPPEPSKPTIKEAPVEISRPPSTPATSSQRPSSTTGTKTILKPGAHLQAGSGKTGLVAKGQQDKPTLVAKPSVQAPVKSPWATLPPVDKVSPIQPPVQHPSPARYGMRDLQGYESLPPAGTPAKEIAPDDFNRSWRDDRGNRELFNSHSGRYEPVHETRRGSVRDNFRQQPSVLQRPSQDGPAEPSAAFQTSRTSVDGPAWGRRRNSSNVSGGSGRRLSFDRRGPDIPLPLNIQRRESHSVNGSDGATPGTPRQAFAKAIHPDGFHIVPEQLHSWTQRSSPNLAQVQPASPYGSVASSGHQDAATPGAPTPIESAVEVQNRLMREKLERARLAKQKEREREEKEEAERKERLRKKLQTLGLVDDSKPKSNDPSPSRPVERSPQKEKTVPVPASVHSPPKPPMPTSEGEVAQYGMMKVHQPQPVKKHYHSEAPASKFSKAAEPVVRPTPSPVKAQAEVQPKPRSTFTQAHAQPLSNLDRGATIKKPLLETSQTQQQQPEVEPRAGTQGLKTTPGAWSNSISQQSRPWSSTVWGPPQTKDRALGNGTFDSGYNRGQPRPTAPPLPSQAPSGQPPAIGSHTSHKPPPSQPTVTPNQPFVQQTIYAQPEALPPQPPTMAPAPSSNIHPPRPIAPPTEKPSWGHFTAAIRRDDHAMIAKANEDLERFSGQTYRPEFRETYTDKQGKSQKTVHQKVGGNAALLNGNINSDISQSTPIVDIKTKDDAVKAVGSNTHVNEGSSFQATAAQGTHLQPPGQTGRSSRFFPRTSEATQPSSTASSLSDSPPPPETESHPAFTGDSHHPVVKMPKPSPRVRLPPAAADSVVPAEAPVSMPSRVRLGLGARPLALDPEWQARFNSLLEKSSPAIAPVPAKGPSPIQPPVHAKLGSLAVAASSKAPLDVRENKASATVSLPNSVLRKSFADDDSNDIVTRVRAEEVLLEEREFGSLPIVKLSKVPHLAANEPPIGFPSSRPTSRHHRSLEITSKPALHMLDYDADCIDVVVRLTNMRDPITKSIPRKRGRKGFGPKSKRNFTPTNGASGSGQNQRLRKSSSYQGQGPGLNSNNASRPSSGGNGWSNNRSAPSHNNSWVRRAAPVH
ncbi:hypothetical protein CC78DRAFT_578945 [Lojkania enalia]|uniref:Uncharacterized protein n=1 Tax=Lojkania enalia TaxID=147567 RepID=A0A9P4KCN6_9PLEO|nr:hypothetical protein CC78DRAFT_578945 [Didymosphaeria enalia]